MLVCNPLLSLCVFVSVSVMLGAPSIVSFPNYSLALMCVSLSLTSSLSPSLGAYLLVCLYLLPTASLSLTPYFSLCLSLSGCIIGQTWMTWRPFLVGMCLGT